MKNDHLFRLLYLLLERGAMRAAELASALEVCVRTIYRDVEALSKAGAPIYAAAGRGGGIALVPGYTLDRALFSKEEREQLPLAMQSLQATDLRMEARLSRLAAVFRGDGASWIAVDFSRWGCGRADGERSEQLKAAILGRRVLRIRYWGAAGRPSERSIKPFRLDL